MNTLKNVLFFGLLLAVLCGVYLSLNRSPEPTLAAGADGDTTPPKVEIPGLTGPPVTQIVVRPGHPAALPVFRPAADDARLRRSQADMAPPFQPPPTCRRRADTAPPWPPGIAGQLPPAAARRPRHEIPAGCAATSVRLAGQSRSVRRRPADSPPPAAMPCRRRRPSIRRRPASNRIMQQVKLKVEENRLADALLILSQLYGNPDLPPSQAREVTQILDQMAAKVIYSREHLLESPYLVQAGDTLETIADRYQVPALLLARINGIRDPQNLPPGKELKVLKGPFSAQISTDRSEMTMMLAGRYAGRFNVVLSNDLSHATGLCTVRDKRPPTAAAGSGSGKQWIELGNASGKISMQGTNDTRVTTGRDSRNTIWLSEQDMDDVFGILSVGSRVIIQR